MNGLYALKPWYAARLGRLRHGLVRRRVSPHAVTVAGILAGAGAGTLLWLRPPGIVTGLGVTALLAARLACANLDGGVARESGRSTRFGAVLNEVGDRVAELAVLAGLLATAPVALVALAALAASAPSWVSLAGAAAGSVRLQGGPVGKTERCVLLAAIAFTGWAVPLLAVLAAGSAVTALVRLSRLAVAR